MDKSFFIRYRLKIGLISLGVVLISVLGIMTWQDKVSTAAQRVDKSWVLLQKNSDKRTQLLGQFVQIMPASAAQATHSLNQAYQETLQFPGSAQVLNDQQALEKFLALQKQVVMALLEMEKYALRDQNLAHNSQFLALERRLQEVEAQIVYAENALAHQINRYNRYLQGFPFTWLNRVFDYPLKFPCDILTMREVVRYSK